MDRDDPDWTNGAILKNAGERWPNIIIEESDPPASQRFTVAHELGHYLDAIRGLDDQAITDLPLCEIRKRNGDHSQREERVADLIAHRLVMPSIAVAILVSAETSQPDMMDWFGATKTSLDIRLGELGQAI